MELKDKLILQLDKQHFPSPWTTLIVAVSGGVDSVVLLHLLYLLVGQYDWEIIVAHFDHQLRAASSQDAKFVEGLAKSLGLKFVFGTANVIKLAKTRKLTIEEAGRWARYTWLQKMARKYRAEVIALAHTADDQAETIMMNWLRGGLARALTGMRSKENNLWRPLLSVPKTELVEFAQKYHLEFQEDSSNKNLAYTRNLIRHQILPILEKVNPGIKEVLGRNADSWAELETCLDHLTQDIYKKVANKSGADTVNFKEASFQRLDKFMQNELLLLAIQQLKGDRQDFKRAHLDEMQTILISPKPRAWKQFPGKLFLSRGYGKISVSYKRPNFTNK